MEEVLKNLLIELLRTREYDDIITEYAGEYLEMVSTDDIPYMLRNGDFNYEVEYLFEDWIAEKGWVHKDVISDHIEDGEYDTEAEKRLSIRYRTPISKALKDREDILDLEHQKLHPNDTLSYRYCGKLPCRAWDDVL